MSDELKDAAMIKLANLLKPVVLEYTAAKDAEILRLQKENQKLREAVIKERFWNLWKTGKWDTVEHASRDAEAELRAEGVI